MINDKKDLLKIFKYLVLINLIALVFMINQTRTNGNIHLVSTESNMLFFTNSFQSPVFAYNMIGTLYDYSQYKHIERTDISIELFQELLERGQIKEARSATYHNIRDCNNVKYLSNDGRDEYIVKVEYTERGEVNHLILIRDAINRGTYNLFNQEGTWLTRRLHKTDVYLWVLFGTGSSDSSSLKDRIYFSFYHQPVGCAEEVEDSK